MPLRRAPGRQALGSWSDAGGVVVRCLVRCKPPAQKRKRFRENSLQQHGQVQQPRGSFGSAQDRLFDFARRGGLRSRLQGKCCNTTDPPPWYLHFSKCRNSRTHLKLVLHDSHPITQPRSAPGAQGNSNWQIAVGNGLAKTSLFDSVVIVINLPFLSGNVEIVPNLNSTELILASIYV